MKKIKVMKKSMFLSTILMVVLLIVALSTATFAWFSANSSVAATQTVMTAASSTATDIAIGWGADPSGSSIDFAPANGMQPAIPNISPVATTESTAFILNTALIDIEGKFRSDGAAVTGDMTNVDGSSTFFYVKNNGVNASYINVTMTVSDITGTMQTDFIRVAVFVRDAADATAPFIYKGTLASSAAAEVKYGTITSGSAAADIATAYSSATASELGQIASKASYAIKFVAWYDGAKLTADVGGGGSLKIAFTFNGSQTAPTPAP